MSQTTRQLRERLAFLRDRIERGAPHPPEYETERNEIREMLGMEPVSPGCWDFTDYSDPASR